MTNNKKLLSSRLMLRYNKLDRLYETNLFRIVKYFRVMPEHAQVYHVRCSTLPTGSLSHRKY